MIHFNRMIALSALLATAPAAAAIVTFEGEPLGGSTCSPGSKAVGGLTFASIGFGCTLGPADFSNWPSAPASTIYVNGYSDTVITRTGGGAFTFQSFDAQIGTYNTNLGGSDSILVTGFLSAGGTVSALLTITDPMTNFAFSWGSLSSLTIGQASGSGYTGFDNFAFDAAGAVPEPATWAMMVAGFGLAGGAMRYRRHKVRVSYNA